MIATGKKFQNTIFKIQSKFQYTISKSQKKVIQPHLLFGDWDLFEICFLDIVICLPHIQFAKQLGLACT